MRHGLLSTDNDTFLGDAPSLTGWQRKRDSAASSRRLCEELGSFADPGAATDFAQQEVRRKEHGVAAENLDPPDDLVGIG
jgi:hypothetical protein